MTENRIDRTLQALKQQGKKALIPFVTAGHGGYDRTRSGSRNNSPMHS